MSKADGQQLFPVEGILARMKAGMAGFKAGFTGNGAEWFGPGTPNPPTAPEDVAGRQFQVPVAYNQLIQGKTEGMTVAGLRSMADSTDIVRILIENRKDVITSLAWSIEERANVINKTPGQPAPKKNADAEMLEEFFSYPDMDHPWSVWLRMLLEDLLVLDMPALYVQRTKGGDLYALRPVDGGTIKRIIDGKGWTPAPPLPAYQQILQGTPAVNYTSEELIYRPRNVRTNKIYGYSRVEQILITMTLWMYRQASNLEYYKAGSVPDGFLSASASWNAKDIAQYQAMFDLQNAGQLAERRKVKVTPHDSKYTPVKEPALKNDYDEQLIRIACFCMGTSPTPFIKQMNRATGEVAKEAATEEGVGADMLWVKMLMDEVIQLRLGYHELEFSWKDREAQDPLERAEVDQIYLNSGVVKPNEVRADLNMDPLPEEENHVPQPAAPGNNPKPGDEPPEGEPGDPAAKPAKDGGAAGAAGKKAAKVAKRYFSRPRTLKRSGEGVLLEKAAAGARPLSQYQEIQRDKLSAAMRSAFDGMRQKAVMGFLEAVAKTMPAVITKATGEEDDKVQGQPAEGDPATIAASLDLSDLSASYDATSDVLEVTAQDGSRTALARVSSEDPNALSGGDITNVANRDAIAWARAHAAELIGEDAAEEGILDTATRNMLKATIGQAMQQKLTAEEIAQLLEQDYAFSDTRALLIAETEVANASSYGQLAGYTAAGMTVKKWLLSKDEGVCIICLANSEAGWVAIDKPFPGGVQAPLQHPNCRCVIVARRQPPE